MFLLQGLIASFGRYDMFTLESATFRRFGRLYSVFVMCKIHCTQEVRNQQGYKAIHFSTACTGTEEGWTFACTRHLPSFSSQASCHSIPSRFLPTAVSNFLRIERVDLTTCRERTLAVLSTLYPCAFVFDFETVQDRKIKRCLIKKAVNCFRLFLFYLFFS